jgi:hypothetical protein
MRNFAAGVALALLATACSSTTSSADFALDDAVDCRELGGGWVFIRYEQDGAWMQGTRLGVPSTDGGLQAEPEVTDEELDEATRQRIAAGWDDRSVAALSEPETAPELTSRLATMPSCLDQMRPSGG